jgi:hypothetical protein
MNYQFGRAPKADALDSVQPQRPERDSFASGAQRDKEVNDNTVFSHLVPCRVCAAMNGRSASFCWNCEADRTALQSAAPTMAPEHEAAQTEADVFGQASSFFNSGPGDVTRTHALATSPLDTGALHLMDPGLAVSFSTESGHLTVAEYAAVNARKPQARTYDTAIAFILTLLAGVWAALGLGMPFSGPADPPARPSRDWASVDENTGQQAGVPVSPLPLDTAGLSDAGTEPLDARDSPLAPLSSIQSDRPVLPIASTPLRPRNGVAGGLPAGRTGANGAPVELQRRNPRAAQTSGGAVTPLEPCTAAVEALALCSSTKTKAKE